MVGFGAWPGLARKSKLRCMNTETQFKRASRLGRVQVSEIVQIAEAARERRAAGEDVIGLGTGEPSFDTPAHIKEAAAQAMAAGDTKYPTNVGNLALREAVCAKFDRENDLAVDVDQVIVSTGAKQVLFCAMLATLEPDDEVIVPAPYWTSYLDIVEVCGGSPKVIGCGPEVDYKLTPEQLQAAITSKTRWLLLNTPGNPTGAAYSAVELQALAAVLAQHPQVWVATDEIYEHLVYDGFECRTLPALVPTLAERCLVINGVSKAYAMTGWRIGYGAGPKALISALSAAQGQMTSGACSIAQAAAVAALNGPQTLVAEWCESYRQRRNRLYEAIDGISGLQCRLPEGAYYLFPNCAELIGAVTPAGATLADGTDFCEYLLASENLAVVPGRAFGMADHFRLSYAYAAEDLDEAAVRLARACAALR